MRAVRLDRPRSIETVNWNIAILLGLAFVSIVQPRLNVFTVMQNICLLLALLALMLVVLLLLSAFALLREAGRVGLPWLKAGFLRIATFGERKLHAVLREAGRVGLPWLKAGFLRIAKFGERKLHAIQDSHAVR